MKILRTRWMGGAAVSIILAVGLFSTQLHAEDSPASPPSQPGTVTTPFQVGASPSPSPTATPSESDPFIKKDAAVPATEAGPAYNVIFTVEVYNLNQSEGAPLIQENESDQVRHDHLLDLVKNGKAHLDAVLSGTSKLGDRTTIEQVDQLRYPIIFAASSGKDFHATDFKTRNLGYRLTFMIAPFSDKETGGVQMYFEHTFFHGFLDQGLSHEGGLVISQPQFDSQAIILPRIVFPYGKILFLGTMSPASQSPVVSKASPPAQQTEDSEMKLVFGKMDLVQLNPGPPTNGETAPLEHQVSLYSMDRDKASQILSQKQEANSAYDAVLSLVKSNEAKLEHLSVSRSTNGMKIVFRETIEIPYTGGFNIKAADDDPTEAGKTYPEEFDKQDTGFYGEVKPDVMANTSIVGIDLTASTWMKYLGPLRAQGLTEPDGTVPMFEHRSLETKINSILGEHELLGTCNPPGNTGINDQKDTGRVWLEFIQTTLVKP